MSAPSTGIWIKSYVAVGVLTVVVLGLLWALLRSYIREAWSNRHVETSDR